MCHNIKFIMFIICLSLFGPFVSDSGNAFAMCSVSPPEEQGKWVNVNAETRSITKADIKHTCQPIPTVSSLQIPPFTVHLFGSCSPTDCDWGVVTASRLKDGWVTTNIDHGFAKRFVQIKAFPGKTALADRLVVKIHTDFVDPNRPDYDSRDVFSRRNNFTPVKGTTEIQVDCDERQSLEDAFTAVEPNGTISVAGTCELSEPLLLTKSITLDGDENGNRSIIDGKGTDQPVLTIDNVKNVTVKNLEFINGGKGILFSNKARGQLLNVVARLNIVGLEFDSGSSIKADEIVASYNKQAGIKILHGSHVRFMNLEKPAYECKTGSATYAANEDYFETNLFFLSSVAGVEETSGEESPTEETNAPCNVVANHNGSRESLGDHGILVHADPEDYNSGATPRLKIENCRLELSDLNEAGEANGLQDYGLRIINGANATAANATLIANGNYYAGIAAQAVTEEEYRSIGGENFTAEGSQISTDKNRVVGILLTEDATFKLSSSGVTGEEMISSVESNENSYGFAALNNSSLVLEDNVLFKVHDNKQYGLYLNNSKVECEQGQSQVEFYANINEMYVYPLEIKTELIPDVCISRLADDGTE